MKERRLTRTEEAVYMEVLKDNGISIAELTIKMEERYNRAYARTTIATFLERMSAKGYVEMERRGRMTHVTALVDRDTYLEHKIDEIINGWFNGSQDQFLGFIHKHFSAQ